MNYIEEFIKYLNSQENKPSSVTVKNYKADINHFTRWFENTSGSFVPKEVTKQTIETYKTECGSVFSPSSIDRHFSSLRKFFIFLKLEGLIIRSPFEQAILDAQKLETDPWHIKDFRNNLYVYNASHLTIKNYLIDTKQFLNWVKETTASSNVLEEINPKLVEAYRQNLLTQGNFSPATINRKLSSLRKYLAWAGAEGLIGSLEYKVQNTELQKEAEIYIPEAAKESLAINPQPSAASYSNFPPLRLAQKLSEVFLMALDAVFINPVASLAEKARYNLWKANGQQVFTKLKNQNSKFKILASGFQLPIIKNLPKEVYAPLEISTKYFPWHKKALFNLKYRRPQWYKTYHSYPITHYFHLAVLIIFLAAISFGFYNVFFQKGNQTPTLAVALPVAPPRILSFQGRLTDNLDNPISTSSALRFAIYNNVSATDSGDLSVMLWQEVDSVTPDQDGIFNVMLGSNNPIPSTLFTSNANLGLWLGVTVGRTAELTPRQQLATVAFAANSETLQGLVPITASGADVKNVVLALDASGNLTIGAGAVTANPVFQANGTFKISGQPLLLTTNAGSNGNVQIAPDGLGYIDLQKPLVNTTNNNNLVGATGAVEIDDMFGVLATSSASAFTLNQNGNGDLITASTSGTTKFRLANTGQIIAPFYGTAGCTALKSDTSGNITCGTGGGVQFWQELSGALSPTQLGDDLLLGGSTTASAKFAFTGLKGNQTQASISGQMILMPNNGYSGFLGIGTTAPAALTDIYSAANALPSSGLMNLYWNPSAASTIFNGDLFSLNIGANGTVNNLLNIENNGSSVFSVSQTQVTSNIPVQFTSAGDTSMAYDLNFTNPTASFIKSQAPLYIQAGELFNSSDLTLRTSNVGNIIADTQAFVTNYAATVSGQLVVGTQSPNSSAIGGLYLTNSSTFGKALAIFDQYENQDLFTASASGVTKFVISNSGALTSAAYTNAGGLLYTSTSGLIGQTGVGTGTQCLTGGATPAWQSCSGASSNFWQELGGALSPVHSGDDLLLGSNATSTADFAFTGMMGNQTQASFSGQFVVMPNNGWGGNASISGNLTLGAFGASSIQTTKNQLLTIGGNTTGDIQFKPGNSSSSLYLSSSGNVGIGTTTPTQTLDVNGKIKVAGTSAGVAGLMFGSSSFGLGGTNDGVFDIIANGYSKIKLVSSADASRVVFMNTRIISDGVANSSISLEADGTGSILFNTNANSGALTQVAITNTTSAVNYLSFTGAATGGNPTISTLGSDTNVGLNITPKGTGNTIFTNGNVGIGTTSPTAVLDVAGAASVSGSLTFRTGAGAIQTTAFNALTLGGTTTGNIVMAPFNGIAGANVAPNTNQQVDLGTLTNQWRNIYGQNIYSNGNLLTQYWQKNAGNLSPLTANDTIAATSSASTVATFTSNNPTGTLTNNTLIQQTGAGTVTNLLNLTQSAGTATNAIDINGTFTNLINAGTAFTVSNAGAVTGTTLSLNDTAGTATTNIGTGTTTGTVTIGGTGTQTLAIGNGAGVKTVQLGSNNGASVTTILSGTGNLTINNNAGTATTGIGIGTTTGQVTIGGSGTQTIAVGNGAGVKTTQIGSNNGASVTTILSGTGNLTINDTAGTATTNIGTGTTTGTVTIGGSSAISLAGNTTVLTSKTLKLTDITGNNRVLYADSSTAVVTGVATAGTGLCLLSGSTTPAWGSCPGGTNYWQRNLGSLSPANITDDLLIGGISTTAADFAFTGLSGNQTQASMSGNLIVMPNNGWGGNVGIGTTAPNAKLHVVDANGVTNSWGNLDVTTSNSATIDMGGQIDLGGAYTGTTVAAFGTIAGRKEAADSNPTGYLQFATQNGNLIERMRITSGGNVGIGTTNPTSLLQIGPVAATASFINLTAPTNYSAGINFYTGGTSSVYSVGNAQDVRIATNGTDRVTVMYGGNVGIGTTNPTAVLDVAGAASVSGSLTFRTGVGAIQTTAFNALTLGGTTTGNITLSPFNSALGANVTPGITNQVDLGTAALQWRNIYAANFYQNGTLINLVNYWQRNLGSLSPANITDDLLLGGTSTTSAKFAFINMIGSGAPTASISGNLSLVVPTGSNPLAQLNLFNGGSLNIQTSVGGEFGLTSALYIANNGNVGIGNVNPQAKLDIGGATSTISNTSGNITITPNANLIISSGSVGIGTTNPLSTLDVRGNSGTLAVASVSGSTTFAALVANNNGLGDLFTASSSGLTKFVIKNNGSVGIGVASPLATLDVRGNSGTTPIASFSGSTSFAGLVVDNSGPGDLIVASSSAISPNPARTQFQVTNTGNIYARAFYDLDSTSYFLDPANSSGTSLAVAGKVGIGNNNPATALDVRNALGTSTIASISGQLIVMPNGGWGGQVGIGTTAPLTPLEIRTEENGVASNIASMLTLSRHVNTPGGLITGGGVSLDFRATDQQNFQTNPPLTAQIGTVNTYGQNNNAQPALFFNTGNNGTMTEKMRITYDGNVGIGTTNPLNKLHVADSSSDTTLTGSVGLRIENTDTTNNNYVNIKFGAQDAGGGHGYGGLIGSQITSHTAGTMNGDLYFMTTLAGVPNERMRILSGGNVGIGTPTPGSKLDVVGGGVAIGTNSYSNLNDGGLTIGDITVDYTPNSSNWASSGTTLILSGLNYSAIGFHDSGARVDFIRTGAGTMTLGYDGGWGPASIAVPGSLTVAGVTNVNGGLSQGGNVILNGSDTWLRTTGNTGWFNATYGVGMYAVTAGRVDVYNGASLYVPNIITTGGGGAYSGAICGASGSECLAFNTNGWVYTTDTSNGVYGNTGMAMAKLSVAGPTYLYGTITDQGGDAGSNALFGPNAAYGKYLYIGAGIIAGGGNHIDGNTGQVVVTNGNLHLDSASGGTPTTYINYYSTGSVRIGEGGGQVFANIASNSSTSLLCKSAAGGGMRYLLVCQNTLQVGDIAENIIAPTAEAGDIVAIDRNAPDQTNVPMNKRVTYGAITGKPYDQNTLGIISTSGLVYFENDLGPNSRPLTTSGVVPTKVATINGAIHKGDSITTSLIPGAGMVATKAGPIVGKAEEDWDGSSATQSAQLINGNWTTVNSPCQTGQVNCYNQDQILVLLTVAWSDPQVQLASTGDLNFVDQTATADANFTIPHYFTLNDALGNPISRVGAFSDAVIANLRVGLVNAQQITTNALSVATENITINGQNIRDYIAGIVNGIINSTNNTVNSPIASTDQIHTNFISPIGSDANIGLKLDNNKLSVLNTNSASGSAVATIDNQGNASFSGQLTSNGLNTNDATISGTLHVGRIIADQIVGATSSATYVTNITNIYNSTPSAAVNNNANGSANTNFGLIANAATNGTSSASMPTTSGSYIDISSYSGQLSYVENLSASTASFSQGLMVFGPTSLSDTSIVGQLSVDGSLILANNSINVLGSDLSLQPLRQGGLSIMGGLVYIDTEGNLKVSGNAEFAKDVKVGGTLSANIISPLAGSDLTLGSGNSNLEVKGASNSSILSVNPLGDLIASGAATISKLNLSLIQPALAVSPTEVVATGSAGTTNIAANKTQVTIDNPLVTDKSLIYITPTSNTNNQVLYLLRQNPGKSFTVGLQNPSVTSIPFNWIIVN